MTTNKARVALDDEDRRLCRHREITGDDARREWACLRCGKPFIPADAVPVDAEHAECDAEIARLNEHVRLADAAAASMVSKANDALTLLYEMIQEPKFPIAANGPARTFLTYAAPAPSDAAIPADAVAAALPDSSLDADADPFSRSGQPLILGPASVDAAWDDAEAALPEGWHGPAVEPRWPDRWRAWVYQPWPSPVEPRSVFGESEADALRVLAAELRESER